MMVVVMMVRMMMMMEVGERAVGGGAGVADTAERDRDEGGFTVYSGFAVLIRIYCLLRCPPDHM